MIPLGAFYGTYRNATPMTNKPLSSHGSLFRKRRPKEGPSNTSDSSSSVVNLSPVISPTPTLTDDLSSVSSRPSTAFRTDSSGRRESSISSLSDLKDHFRRHSASIRSNRAPPPPHSDNLAFVQSSDSPAASTTSLRPILNVSTVSSQPSSDTLNKLEYRTPRPPNSAVEPRPLRNPPPGLAVKREDSLRPPTASNSANAAGRSVSLGHAAQGGGSQSNPRTVWQNIYDVASKRISTLDYLRKAHDGRVYWFNALRFTKEDLYKMPYFDPRKLGRRAASYLLLGVSIPAILDPNKDAALEYLRAFNSLLNEFESYQSIHPPDGTAPSSLSRARIPQMFKRATNASAAKGRRGSSADALSPQNTNDTGEARSAGGLHSASSTSSYTSFPASDQELLPGEEYSFLLTPSLPFDPDYFETFATLCEVLIDCYSQIMQLLGTPEAVVAGIGDLFSKVDAKVRKILVAGLVRDFEDASKQGIRSELAGVGKVVLGGLM